MRRFVGIVLFLAGMPGIAAGGSRGCELDAFVGNYAVDLQIGAETLTDRLTIEGVETESSCAFASFSGEYAVPDGFTAVVEEGRFRQSLWSGGVTANFRIVADERGTTYPVYFDVVFSPDGPDAGEGLASYDREGRHPLGRVVVRRETDESSSRRAR